MLRRLLPAADAGDHRDRANAGKDFVSQALAVWMGLPMVVLGIEISISVNARAVLPCNNSAHPRILPKVLLSTGFSGFREVVAVPRIEGLQHRP